MAEALAVIGIVSNILQLADFCAKVTDRTLEFAGRAAQLPGTFSDLRVVMSLVALNLQKLQSRMESAKPDREELRTMKDVVKIIERDAKIVQHYLEKHLPKPDAPWVKVTMKAINSVFSESKIKRATESIMEKCELLGQTVTASLPTAEEIAKAVNERQTSTIDRRLSIMLDKMKNNAVSKTAVNKTTFNNQQHQHRHTTTGHAINVKGHTQINNTYITVQMGYDEFGAQMDQGALAKASLTVPGTNLPFHPLIKSVSNPDLHGSIIQPKRRKPAALPPQGSGFVVEEASDDENQAHTPRGTSPHHDVSRRSTTGGTSARSRTPQPSTGIPFDPSSYNDLLSPKSPGRKRFPSAESRPRPIDTQSEIWDNRTVAPSVIPSNIGSTIGLGHDRLPPSPRAARPTMPSPRSSYNSNTSGKTRSHRPSLSSNSIPTPTFLASPVSSDILHSSIFELDGGAGAIAASLSGIESASDVNTASDAWSETMGSPTYVDTDGASSIMSGTTVVEDHDAINTVNGFIRSGAAAVTSNPSEAKRAYMSAMNTCKSIVAYSPTFSVRKFRALTLSAVGLSLCTMDRERYLRKARDYNTQAMTAANRTDDIALVTRVRLDEADLQMKEARMLEKKGMGPDATMKQFTAFGTYQTIASELNGQAYSVLDCNTQALALLGCGKLAAVLGRNPGSFSTSMGTIQQPRTYLEQALQSCNRGRGIQGARQDDLALLRDTEEQVQKTITSIR